jgi:hypothetical protein
VGKPSRLALGRLNATAATRFRAAELEPRRVTQSSETDSEHRVRTRTKNNAYEARRLNRNRRAQIEGA